MRRSFILGLVGCLVVVGLSINQLVSRIQTFFWWSPGTYVSGEALIISGIIGLFAGLLGLYGSVIGKKLGGGLMIAAGIFIFAGTALLLMFFGSLLIIGGLMAIREKVDMKENPI